MTERTAEKIANAVRHECPRRLIRGRIESDEPWIAPFVFEGADDGARREEAEDREHAESKTLEPWMQ